MNQSQVLFEKINAWLQDNPEILASILVGSVARKDHPSDQYSDYDIEIYSDNYESYAKNEKWLSQFGDIWVNVREKSDEGHPARLVIYNGGIKVDFSLHPTESLTKIIKKGVIPNYYQYGYRFLVDRGSFENEFRQCQFDAHFDDLNPSEFQRIIEEFWFEAWHIAKYLKRKDLWVVKVRDAGIKEFLLKMIEWHSKSKNPNVNTWHQGRFMHEWADSKVLEELDSCFGHFNEVDSWKSLFAMMDLFRRVSKEAAKNLNYSYPTPVDVNISNWINAQFIK